MGHHLAWLLGCCYQRDPAKCPIPRSSREVGSAPAPGDPLWAMQQQGAGLPCPARRGSAAPCAEEQQHYGGSDHRVPPLVCTYTMTEPWGIFPQQPVNPAHVYQSPVNQRDGCGEVRKRYAVLSQREALLWEMAQSQVVVWNQLNTPEEAENTSLKPYWTRPAQWRFPDCSDWSITSAQANLTLHIWEEKSSALPLLQQNPCDFHAILTCSIVCSSMHLNCH